LIKQQLLIYARLAYIGYKHKIKHFLGGEIPYLVMCFTPQDSDDLEFLLYWCTIHGCVSRLPSLN
jgi:hypothetical protein